MILGDLLIWFKASKIPNVHRVYEVFRYIDDNYHQRDLNNALSEIDSLYTTLCTKYKPTSVRNYMRDFMASLDMEVIVSNTQPSILEQAKIKAKEYTQAADKLVNNVQSEEGLNININEIVNKAVPSSDSDSYSFVADTNSEYIRLQAENKRLIDEVNWLRNLVTLMHSK